MALVAYYKLEDVNDSSGNGYTLTNVNSVTFTAAKFGLGANLGANNTNKYLYVANTLGITGGACTLSIWVKILTEIPNDTVSTLVIASEDTNHTACMILYQATGATKQLNFRRDRSGVVTVSIVYNITLGTTNWYHIAFAYDGSNFIGYVNGVAVIDPTAASGNGTSGFTKFQIGAEPSVPTNFASMIADECKVYNEGLSANQIMNLYRYGRRGGFLLFMT